MRWTLFLLALAACDSSPDTAQSGAVDFGDDYTVLEAAISGSDLEVTVQHSGGCETHGFEVGTRSADGATQVWLTHDANGDLCEALITDQVSIDLEGVTGPVVLLEPDGDATTVRD